MKPAALSSTTKAVAFLAALASTVHAENKDPFGLPTCQGIPFGPEFAAGAIAFGCQSSDIKCLCNLPGVLETIPVSLEAVCSNDQVNKAKHNIVSQCAKAGVTIDPSGFDNTDAMPTGYDIGGAMPTGFDVPTAAATSATNTEAATGAKPTADVKEKSSSGGGSANAGTKATTMMMSAEGLFWGVLGAVICFM